MNKDIITIRQSQIRRSVMLCILAQNYMNEGKKFGAIVWGQSGIGKNHATDNLHKEFSEITGEKWGFLDINVSGIMPEDMTGLPANNNGKAVYLPLIKAGDESFGICRIDEIDRPTNMGVLIQAAKFAIDRTTQSPLPEDWFILAQGNGVSDSFTQELTEHIRGRFIHLYVSMNSQQAQDEYNSYLKSRNASPVIQKLVRLNPIKTRDEFEVHAVVNPRTIEYADCIVKAYTEAKEGGEDFSDVLFPVLAGTVGKFLAAEIVKGLEMGDLPSLDEICENPKGAIIPENLSLRHRFVSVLISEVADNCQKAEKLVEYLTRYPAEVARYALDNLILSCPSVAKTSVYVTWQKRLN
jgi:hypothetical protein